MQVSSQLCGLAEISSFYFMFVCASLSYVGLQRYFFLFYFIFTCLSVQVSSQLCGLTKMFLFYFYFMSVCTSLSSAMWVCQNAFILFNMSVCTSHTSIMFVCQNVFLLFYFMSVCTVTPSLCGASKMSSFYFINEEAVTDHYH